MSRSLSVAVITFLQAKRSLQLAAALFLEVEPVRGHISAIALLDEEVVNLTGIGQNVSESITITSSTDAQT
jgi:hypothetical protein